MSELYSRKRDAINSKTQDGCGVHGFPSESKGMDLMGSMIRTSDQLSNASDQNGMSKQEILGNSFILFVAGHETAANTIHYSILYLAMHPWLQRDLQAELDEILQGTNPQDLSYDFHLPKLFSGLAGAVMNEELRLIPPITIIPKTTSTSQSLVIDGVERTVPAGTIVALNSPAVHRNPKYWPWMNGTNDLDEFNPYRWLKNPSNTPKSVPQSGAVDQDPYGLEVEDDTLSDICSKFRPRSGAYIPFSEGPRSCLGRRFAQVEILACLAVIFSQYSVELSVEIPDISDERDVLLGANEEMKKSRWNAARQEAKRKMDQEMFSVITLQFRKGGVKVRIVERGQEVFDYKESDVSG